MIIKNEDIEQDIKIAVRLHKQFFDDFFGKVDNDYQEEKDRIASQEPFKHEMKHE